MDRSDLLRDGLVRRRHRLHRVVQRRHDVAGSKTGFLLGATPRSQQIAIVVGALVSAVVLGPILLKLNDVATVYVPRVTQEVENGQTRQAENFPASLRVDPSSLTDREIYQGREYLVWHKQSTEDGP